MARAQRLPWRRHSALAVLALCLGAGLRPGELVAATTADVVASTGVLDITVRGARGRTVRVQRPYRAFVLELSAETNGELLFHPEAADRSYPNFVNDFCRSVVRDPSASKLSANRCRASFICDHLSSGTPLSALLEMVGINEVASLLRYARHVDGVPDSKAGLRARLVAERP